MFLFCTLSIIWYHILSSFGSFLKSQNDSEQAQDIQKKIWLTKFFGYFVIYRVVYLSIKKTFSIGFKWGLVDKLYYSI